MNGFDKVIKPHREELISLKDIWEYRDLLFILIKRDFILYYKQTVLGPLWYLIQPIITTITYIVIFGNIAGIGTDDIPQPLFYFSGIIFWNLFSENLVKSSNVFQDNKALFGKIYFPRIIALISANIGQLIKTLLQLFLFVVLYVCYIMRGVDINATWRIICLPLVVLWVVILSMGIGMVIAAITTKYRDLAMALSFLLSLMMYITPVAYPISVVPDYLKIVFFINPMSAPIEVFRRCFFLTEQVDYKMIVCSVTFTAILFIGGLISFNKNEQTFVDMI